MNPIAGKVAVDCVYRETWADAYGARGWKLRSAIDDPEIIASTPETGDRIPTSVLVHDVLDHALCGLGPSGHRNEAVALGQLASRTGADPRPDFAQIVDEDLLQGRILGEALHDLLPVDLVELLPLPTRNDRAAIGFLEHRIGRSALRARLTGRLEELSRAGAAAAQAHYRHHGLPYDRRRQLGMALQQLFRQADGLVLDRSLPTAAAQIEFWRDRCCFAVCTPVARRWSAAY